MQHGGYKHHDDDIEQPTYRPVCPSTSSLLYISKFDTNE